MIGAVVGGLLILLGVIVGIAQAAERKNLAASLARVVEEAVVVSKTEILDSLYRTAGVQNPVTVFTPSDGSLPIQSSCPKCKKGTGRAFFHVVYHAQTDRLHVMCGEKGAVSGEVICGCGAKWIELPGDSK